MMDGGECLHQIGVRLKNAAHVHTFLKTESSTFHFACSRNLKTQVAFLTSSTFLFLQKRN